MDADGQWAVLLGVSRDDQGRAMASIEGQAGLNSQITPTEWDHHRHCLKNPKDADVVIKINQALEDLNERQRRRAKEALKAFEGFEGTLSADLEDRSLSRILEGEAGTVAVCVPNFWIRKKNGKVKSGYFGAIFRIQDQELVLDDAVAAECFCFAKTLLVGKKMMFRIGTRKNSRTGQDEAVVDLDVGAFCRKNGFKGRLSNDDFQSLIMLAQLVRNRLNREDVYAPEAPPPKGEDEDEDNDQEAGFEENSSTDAPAVASEPQGS
jgi:hypothetical protein